MQKCPMHKDRQHSSVVIANVGRRLDGDSNGDQEKRTLVKGAVKYYAAMKRMDAFLCVQIREDLWDTSENYTIKSTRQTGFPHVQKGVQKTNHPSP